MSHPAFIALMQNASLLLAMVVVFDLITSRRPLEVKLRGQALAGVVIGGLCIGLVLASFRLETGIVFDTRSVMLSISGLFFGAIPTFVAMAITAAFRLWQGGAGAWTGALAILGTGGLGIVWRHYRRGHLEDITALELYLFGVTAHLIMLALMLTLPWEIALRVLSGIALPVMLVYPVATIALGLLLANRLRRENIAAALAESESKYRTLVENIPQKIFTKDKNSVYVSANENFARDFDITPDEFVGKTDHDLFPGELADKYRADDRRIMEAGRPEVIEEKYVQGGHEVWVQTIKTPIRDNKGTIIGILGIFWDITERKRTEETLEASKENYRTLFREMLSAFARCEIICDAQGRPVDSRYLEVNPTYERMVGKKAEDLLGKRLFELFPDLEPDWIETLGRVALTGQPVHIEKEVAPLGIWIDLMAFCPAPNQYACTFTDITERKRTDEQLRLAVKETRRLLALAEQSRAALLSLVEDQKRAEEEIRKLNAELEERVRHRTAQLEATNKELEAFAYSVSHDLRAPLRAIDGYSQILQEDYAPLLGEEGLRVSSVISESARTMGQLIDDLLTFSRTGRVKMRPSVVDMETMARSIFFELATHEDRDRIDFRVGSLPPAVGDPALMRQVWGNLLGNAVKFSSKKDRAVIEVSGERKADEVIYAVRDNGAGFDMQYADKLFGVFQRLHSAREFEGTGVGLAIVQRIVSRHGGRIWGEATVDEGATFYFTLGEEN